MKTFFTILLYLIIILLIGALVFGGWYLLERPLTEAAVVFGMIMACWLLIILTKKLIIRYRARAQVQRVIQKENALRDADLGMSPKQLAKSLRKSWSRAVKSLKKSHLKLRGDPLYVLPWYMVFGKPRSGKSTALKNAKLLSPAMELSEHADGSTLNLEWWLYDQAIVIDTAGRYAVPDIDKRDRQEWTTLLQMLSRHRQKEPLNGLVLVVAADRLLNDSEEELRAEGQQVRSGINELMERLEIQMPVYLMVTKCDLIDQFSNWCQYLPKDSLDQVMGYLCEEDVTNIETTLDFVFDKVLDRLKELRLLMMERGDYHDDSLIELPINLEKIRSGLQAFAQTALKDNLYQETPRFRGLYFSSSQQQVDTNNPEQMKDRGLFLHQLFTKVMPPDRGLLSTLPSAERLRRALRNYGMSIGGGLLGLFLLGLSSAFIGDSTGLEKVVDSHAKIELTQTNMNLQFGTTNRLSELMQDLNEAEAGWTLPWYGPYVSSPHSGRMKRTYLDSFRTDMLTRLDDKIADAANSELNSRDRAYLVSGIVRRINLLSAKLEQDFGKIDSLPEVPAEYIRVVDSTVSVESSQLFDLLYRKYILLELSDIELSDERLRLQGALEGVISASRGDFEWLITYTSLQGFPDVKVGDFWRGSRQLVDEPTVSSAYTVEGLEFIEAFLDELNLAGSESNMLSSVKDNFMVFYQRNYLKAWVAFAEEFDYGKNKLRGRKEWLTAMESMTTPSNPYFAVMRKIESEVEPIFSEGLLKAREEIAYFAELQEHSGDASGADNSKAKKKATKAALKVIGKLGKVGKLVAGGAKKGLKAKKKMGGKDQETLDKELEVAAKAYQDYKEALKNIAFNGDSVKLSYGEVTNSFANPDDLGAGDGAGSQAWAAIINLQRVVGKPSEGTRLFWDLYSGPVRLAYQFMREEAACYLQSSWEDNVLAELDGVSDEKIGEALIGEGGILWKFVDNDAAPFLKKKHRKGYIPNRVKDYSMEWDASFIQFVNNADAGRQIVSGEFNVKISALPTGINRSALISPYATFIDLHCADGVQTLSNYNYSASNEFKWSLKNCGDTTLRIEVGEYSLRKQYTGQKGFSKFLQDFQDGRRIFTVKEFPEFTTQLTEKKVQAIDVNYEIKGQDPVIQMLKAVPLDPPSQALACWVN
ncbi:MAG: type VI secretion system protein ImpL [Gammaproteobacteria bacterium]|jgi:type VI secretion system protein ImpL